MDQLDIDMMKTANSALLKQNKMYLHSLIALEKDFLRFYTLSRTPNGKRTVEYKAICDKVEKIKAEIEVPIP